MLRFRPTQTARTSAQETRRRHLNEIGTAQPPIPAMVRQPRRVPSSRNAKARNMHAMAVTVGAARLANFSMVPGTSWIHRNRIRPNCTAGSKRLPNRAVRRFGWSALRSRMWRQKRQYTDEFSSHRDAARSAGVLWIPPRNTSPIRIARRRNGRSIERNGARTSESGARRCRTQTRGNRRRVVATGGMPSASPAQRNTARTQRPGDMAAMIA
jgi:hypothetical protein